MGHALGSPASGHEQAEVTFAPVLHASLTSVGLWLTVSGVGLALIVQVVVEGGLGLLCEAIYRVHHDALGGRLRGPLWFHRPFGWVYKQLHWRLSARLQYGRWAGQRRAVVWALRLFAAGLVVAGAVT